MTGCQTQHSRGFTLVEVMIVVVIVGVLAGLAIYGVTRYLASSKSSEAKNNVGAISRAAQAAFAREISPSESVGEGNKSASASHQLCGTAQLVPAAVPKNTKYQPNTAEGQDFSTGDKHTGWKCLKFNLSQPTYYQLSYAKSDSPMAPSNPAKCVQDCYEAGARGDLNGNDVYSMFARTGHINTVTWQLKASTQIYAEAESE